MGKDKKGINPADAFRREEKKKAIKKAQQQKKEVKEVRSLLNDPTKIDEEIAKYQKLSNESRLDKSLKDKIEELKQMKTIALRKQQIEVIQGKRPRSDLPTTSETVQSLPTSSSQHIPPSFTTNLPVTRRPEESVYYHPTFNPLGFPPPGAPVLYRPTQYLPVPSQPQMLPGGMIPRPVFGMAAPVGWNSGPRGIPPPPPPRPGGAIIGGVNGIPLPPPRPLSNQSLQTQAQAVNPYLLAAQQRKEKKRRREEDDAVVDPLDPAADGYTERFHRNKLGKESHEDANLQNQNHLPMTSSSNYYNSETDITQQNSAQVELEMEEEGKSIEEEQSDDEEDLSEDEDDNESVPASAEPPTTSNSTTTSNPIDFSSFAKFTINKEEIMKRRLQTITDNVVVVALPAKPSEEEGGDEENLVAGPSRPPATSQYVVEDVEEDDDNSENNEEEEVVGPSRPPTNFSSYENYYSMPYPIPEASTTTATRYFTAAEIEEEEEDNDEDITPAPATNAKPLLPGFEYYDSDENDEEEEEVSEENADGRKVDSINHFEQPPQIPSTWAINVQRQEEIHGTSAVNTQNSSVSSSDPMIPAKTLKKVKADSALRSLVPNVLKKKIQPPSNDHISRQQQITSSNTETRRSEPATTTMTAPIVSKIAEKEDNLLGDFFNEIEGLGE
eukprot:gene142-148_t